MGSSALSGWLLVVVTKIIVVVVVAWLPLRLEHCARHIVDDFAAIDS